MNYFSKIKFGVWLVIVLTAINLATLATILYKNHEEKCRNIVKTEKKDYKQGVKYLMQEIKLTPEQENFFNTSRCAYFDSSIVFFNKQEVLRLSMIDELSKDYPDTTLLFSISDDMGKNYVHLKKNMIRHFVSCRNICNAEQKIKLNPLYPKLIRPEGSCNVKKKAELCDKKESSN